MQEIQRGIDKVNVERMSPRVGETKTMDNHLKQTLRKLHVQDNDKVKVSLRGLNLSLPTL